MYIRKNCSLFLNSTIIKICFVVCLMLASTAIYARWSLTSGFVNQVYAHKENYVVESSITDNTCGHAGKFYWLTTDPEAKEMYAMALLALSTGKKIAVVYNETSPQCLYSGDRITHMVIYR